MFLFTEFCAIKYIYTCFYFLYFFNVGKNVVCN